MSSTIIVASQISTLSSISSHNSILNLLQYFQLMINYYFKSSNLLNYFSSLFSTFYLFFYTYKENFFIITVTILLSLIISYFFYGPDIFHIGSSLLSNMVLKKSNLSQSDRDAVNSIVKKVNEKYTPKKCPLEKYYNDLKENKITSMQINTDYDYDDFVSRLRLRGFLVYRHKKKSKKKLRYIRCTQEGKFLFYKKFIAKETVTPNGKPYISINLSSLKDCKKIDDKPTSFLLLFDKYSFEFSSDCLLSTNDLFQGFTLLSKKINEDPNYMIRWKNTVDPHIGSISNFQMNGNVSPLLYSSFKEDDAISVNSTATSNTTYSRRF